MKNSSEQYIYSVDELAKLTLKDIVYAVAKLDVTTTVSDAYRGVKIKESTLVASNAQEASRTYDRALLHTLYEMTTDNPWYGIGYGINAHERFIHDQVSSRIDWRQPDTMSTALDTVMYGKLLRDIHIDVAKRLNWVGQDGKIPRAHAAALLYRRESPGSDTNNMIRYKEIGQGGTSVNAAVERITKQLSFRHVNFAQPVMEDPGYELVNGTLYELATLQIDEPLFSAFWEVDYPKWDVAKTFNANCLEGLGYAGMSGVDIFFTELQRDFAQIDAGEL